MYEQQPILNLDPDQYVYENGAYVRIKDTPVYEDVEQSREAKPRRQKKLAKVVLATTLALGIPVVAYGGGHMAGDFLVKKAIQVTHMPGLDAIDPSQDQLWHDLWGGK